jgi:hypothetical protein
MPLQQEVESTTMTKEYDPKELQKLVAERNVPAIKEYMRQHDLVVKNNRIVPDDRSAYYALYEFWDMRQHGRKILLNSLYGSILNNGSRFNDPRIGQSVTLSGRCVVKHMMAKINEVATGEYNHQGAATLYGDTDSLSGCTNITTNRGIVAIEKLFLQCEEKWNHGEKEYSYDPDLRVLSYDAEKEIAKLMPIQYIYRHRTSKPRWKITDELGNEVEMTDDHSIMIERDGVLIEAKPSEVKETDYLISTK